MIRKLLLISILITTIIISIALSVVEPMAPSGPEKENEKREFDQLMKTNYSDILDNYDVEFNNSADVVDSDGLTPDTVLIYDNSQNKLVSISRPNILSFATYYTPGTYKYGGAAYVPSYQDSVVLSSLEKYKTFHTGSVLAEEHALTMQKLFATPT